MQESFISEWEKKWDQVACHVSSKTGLTVVKGSEGEREENILRVMVEENDCVRVRAHYGTGTVIFYAEREIPGLNTTPMGGFFKIEF